MGKIYPDATLTPHFREFLPEWVARQPWYTGTGVPVLSPVGYFRFEDPEGEVGIETHLVADGSVLYQIPMTYRGAPLKEASFTETEALITTAEHSVLGTRWIYDGVADPLWVSELLHLVRTNGTSEPSTKRAIGPAEARGRQLLPAGDTATIELMRVLTTDRPVDERGVAGIVTGTWHPDGPGTAAITGCLAVVREP